jgi:hypothetical protein
MDRSPTHRSGTARIDHARSHHLLAAVRCSLVAALLASQGRSLACRINDVRELEHNSISHYASRRTVGPSVSSRLVSSRLVSHHLLSDTRAPLPEAPRGKRKCWRESLAKQRKSLEGKHGHTTREAGVGKSGQAVVPALLALRACPPLLSSACPTEVVSLTNRCLTSIILINFSVLQQHRTRPRRLPPYVHPPAHLDIQLHPHLGFNPLGSVHCLILPPIDPVPVWILPHLCAVPITLCRVHVPTESQAITAPHRSPLLLARSMLS